MNLCIPLLEIPLTVIKWYQKIGECARLYFLYPKIGIG
nr:MAG TPA: hypothetical protein [Caudoviricetes sp.]